MGPRFESWRGDGKKSLLITATFLIVNCQFGILDFRDVVIYFTPDQIESEMQINTEISALEVS
jgi:hypothetical protein